MEYATLEYYLVIKMVHKTLHNKNMQVSTYRLCGWCVLYVRFMSGLLVCAVSAPLAVPVFS